MLCLSKKNTFTFYLNDLARFAGILCPPGRRYSKNSNSQLRVIPIFKSHSVIALYLSYRQNDIEKKQRWGADVQPHLPAHPPTVRG